MAAAYPKIQGPEPTPPSQSPPVLTSDQPRAQSPVSYFDTLVAPVDITSGDRLERCISTASWVNEVLENKKSTKFHPLESTVTKDAQNITPGESVLFLKKRLTGQPRTNDEFTGTSEYKECKNVPSKAVVSLNAGAQIMNAVAASELRMCKMFTSRGLTPLYLSASRKSEYGGRVANSSQLQRCFRLNEAKITKLVAELAKVKSEAAVAFIQALREKSVVNVCLAAWNAGNASALQHLITYTRSKYGPGRMSKNAGLYKAAPTPAGGSAQLTTNEYLTQVNNRTKGSLTLDSAAAVFDSALRRIFTEYRAVVASGTAKGVVRAPQPSATHQRFGGPGDNHCLGMLAPCTVFSAADYETADQPTKQAEGVNAFVSQYEKLKLGQKRKADTSATDLRDTLAHDIQQQSVDATKVDNTSDISSKGEGWEWSMHITQLFAQAFIESMGSLLSCTFGIEDPFSDEGMRALVGKLENESSSRNNRLVTIRPTILADEYLLMTGNFQIPFVVSDSEDKIDNRKVSPNTPVLVIVSRYHDIDDKIITDVDLRVKLLVKDPILEAVVDKFSTAAVSTVGQPTLASNTREPVLGGCVPLIRGPKSFDRKSASSEVVTGLTNDWFISLMVMSSIGRVGAAVCAGVLRATASAKAIVAGGKSGPQKNKTARKLKATMRIKTDQHMLLLSELGQSVSQWGHQEHNDTLASYWSASGAIRSKALQEAISRSEVLGVQAQLDDKCPTADNFTMAEHRLRKSYYNAVTNSGKGDLDAIVNYSGQFTTYSNWFSGEGSAEANRAWQSYVQTMAGLNSYERKVFNVNGLFNAIARFRFPLVAVSEEDTLNPRYRKGNLKAAAKVIKGLLEMTLQSAFNNLSANEAGFGLGSAMDGWGASNNQLQPSRMQALHSMSRAGNSQNTIVIPINRSRGSVSGVRSEVSGVHIPVAIMSTLISDKLILDGLCSRETSLAAEIRRFVQAVSGAGAKPKETAIFKSGKHTIMFLRYIWFNSAIISLTDTNIIGPVNCIDRKMGDTLYVDYLAIRNLVNNYNDNLSKFSVQGVLDHYCPKKKEQAKNITIEKDEDLKKVLQQITDSLTVFTANKDSEQVTPSSMKTIIKPLQDSDQINTADVAIKEADKLMSVTKLKKLLAFLSDIAKLNMQVREPLRRLVLGHGLSKVELDNLSMPDLAKIFDKVMDINGVAKNSQLGADKTVSLDLNTELPLIIKTFSGYAQHRLAQIQAIPHAVRTTDHELTRELADMQDEAAVTTLPRLILNIRVPSHLTPTAAISIMSAFTRENHNSDLKSQMGIMAPALLKVSGFLDKVTDDTFTLKISDVQEFAQCATITCLICMHSSSGPDLISNGIKELARGVAHVVAESSLVLSRLQGCFSPIPPSAFTLSGMFVPKKELFDDMTEEYVSAIVRSLTRATEVGGGRCSDKLSAKFLHHAASSFNSDETAVSGTLPAASRSDLKDHLKNPVDLWSMHALPHMDVAVSPKYQRNVSSDQLLRLSSYFQGMHVLSTNPTTRPQDWDAQLPGNAAASQFGLASISANNRSFNSALDTLLASPAEVCDLISREFVKNSTDVVHTIGSAQNRGLLQKTLERGAAAVMAPTSTTKVSSPVWASPLEYAICDTVAALSRSGSGITSSTEGQATAREIVRSWNTLSIANYNRDGVTSAEADGSLVMDVVRAPLIAVPDFRQNVVEASRSVYELAALCSVVSKDEEVRSASQNIMNVVERTSPVIHDIGVGRVAGLVSSVASPKQYRRFLTMVSDYRSSLLRRLSVTAFTRPTSNLNAVYDGLMAGQLESAAAGNTHLTLPDRFWMGVFNECLETNTLLADNEGGRGAHLLNAAADAKVRVYGSRVNTYAAVSTDADRLVDSLAALDSDRREKLDSGIGKIEEFVRKLGDLRKPDPLLARLADAQHMYSRLSDITANSVYREYSNMSCGIVKGNATSKTPREQSDAILSALLHELSPMLNSTEPKMAMQLALAGHLIVAKGVSNGLGEQEQVETYNHLLGASGVTDYASFSANTICQRLAADDIKMFLGGAMLQQGVFITFLMNNILSSQMADTLRMQDLSMETKAILVKLVGFCGTLAHAVSAQRVSRRLLKCNQAGQYRSEEAKADASFVTAAYKAYGDLRKRTNHNQSDTVARIFGELASGPSHAGLMMEASIRGPRPKRKSTLQDVLQAGSTVSKWPLTSYLEKYAASGQGRREGGAVLSRGHYKKTYGTDMFASMRDSHTYFMDCLDSDEDEFSLGYDDENEEDMSVSGSDSEGASTSTDPSATDNDDDDDDDAGGFSYDALGRLDALAVPLSRVYGCHGVESDHSPVNSRSALGVILKDAGESDSEYEDEDHGIHLQPENRLRRRAERIVHGPGFLSGSYIFNHPRKAKAFLTRGKRFKPNSGGALGDYFDDSEEEYTSSSDSEDDAGGRGRGTYRRRTREQHTSFVRRATLAFVPKQVRLVSGMVSLITPYDEKKVTGFLGKYQASNKKKRQTMRTNQSIDPTLDTTLPEEYTEGEPAAPSPRTMRRSMLKTAAYVTRVQAENYTKLFDALLTSNAAAPTPSTVLGARVLFAEDLKEVITKRNDLLKDLANVSSSLFTSGGGAQDAIKAVDEARSSNTDGFAGYLGTPLKTLASCLRRKVVTGATNPDDIGLTLKELLSVKDRNHLDWLTTSAFALARSFNSFTYYAVDAVLKSSSVLTDLYKAFTQLIISPEGKQIDVKSTILDSIFNTRMVHTESILGLISPTAFLNHELPTEPKRRSDVEATALSLLRGVNSGQLSRSDAGDVAGLLTFLTSDCLAGYKGDRGGLSLYRMSLTDALARNAPESRLKGAVSLEVGKWRACDDSAFLRRSKPLVDYCLKNAVALENTVGPLRRFIPNGTEPATVGLKQAPSLMVADDLAMLRLEDAETGCAAPGLFMKLSATGNLYGRIDTILNMTQLLINATMAYEAINSTTNVEEAAKQIIQKMKKSRTKALKTPFGDTSIANSAPIPAFSEAIAFKAREVRGSVTTLLADISKQYGLSSKKSPSCSPGITGTKVSVSGFKLILETAVVLSHTKNTLCDLENRLASASTHLNQFKDILEGGVSEARAAMVAVAHTLSRFNSGNGEPYVMEAYLENDRLLTHIVDTELANVSAARRYVTDALNGAKNMHARVLGMVASMAPAEGNPEACRQLAAMGMVAAGDDTVSQCGNFIRHPSTGMWLKTDEECNTGVDACHKRTSQSIFRALNYNHNQILKSKLQTMRCGKYNVTDLFTMDEGDAMNMDRLVEQLTKALATSAQVEKHHHHSEGDLTTTTTTTNPSSSLADTDTGTPLVKKIPFIPIVFENRQSGYTASATEDAAAKHTTRTAELEVAVAELEKQEAYDLSNILAVHNKHKFVSHNQAATVAIFNGGQHASSVIPENERKKTEVSNHSLNLLTSRLPAPTATTMQLPPSAFAAGGGGILSRDTELSATQKLKAYATRVAQDLNNAKEYKELDVVEKRITAAVDYLESLAHKSFFSGGVHTEVNETAMTLVSKAQTAKDGALEMFGEIINQLYKYTPDPSLAAVSMPITVTTTLVKGEGAQGSATAPPVNNLPTDYFKYAYEKLHAAENNSENDSMEHGAVVKNLVEQEAAVRIPLLLSSSNFTRSLRDTVDYFNQYYNAIAQLRIKIDADAKPTTTQALRQTDRDILAKKNSVLPTLNECATMYTNETDAVRTAITLLDNKRGELYLQNNKTKGIIEGINNRLETGDKEAGANDILNYNNVSVGDSKFLTGLRRFADENSGPVYEPSSTPVKRTSTSDTLSETRDKILQNATSDIKAGQDMLTVCYDTAIAQFPKPLSGAELTLATAEARQQDRLSSVEVFIRVMDERMAKLRLRLRASAGEVAEKENNKEDINQMFRKQLEDKYEEVKSNVGIVAASAHAALAKDAGQAPLLLSLGAKIDRLLSRVERIYGHNHQPQGGTRGSSNTNRKDEVASMVSQHIEDPTYSCYMSPMHEIIKQVGTMFNRDKHGPLHTRADIVTSDADLQLMSIIDLSSSVLGSTARGQARTTPMTTPSSIVPGVCELCAMILTNMHTASHRSAHAFNFEDKRSVEELSQTLSAVLSSSDNARVRHDVLSMLEGNNGHIKEFSFTQHQKVACLTPVNTLLGSFTSSIAPNTVLLPTSELFSCPGVDNDKFRSIIHRAVNPMVADAPKTSASIVETLAHTAPNALKLFFPFKDQRRHFNSISDAIISNMSSEAASQLNTTCDQALVETRGSGGYPVFVGRRSGTSRITAPAMGRGGMPGHAGDRAPFIDMDAKFMVAPGSLLNPKKEQMLRMNKISDINNVRHNDTDVHVAGSNAAWRISEVLKAASSNGDSNDTAQKMLLLGCVSAVSAQKSAVYNNDPTAMLNTTTAIQNLVSEAFPSPLSMAHYSGSAEQAFATQLSYKHRLFPLPVTVGGSGSEAVQWMGESSTMCPLGLLNKMRRYEDGFSKLPKGPGGCNSLLKAAMANKQLSATPVGRFEEAASAVRNKLGTSPTGVNKLSVEAMTDTVVDTLAAVSSIIGRQRVHNIKPVSPSIMAMGTRGQPSHREAKNYLLDAIARISNEASFLDRDGGLGESSFTAFLNATSASNPPVLADNSTAVKNNAAEVVLSTIITSAQELDLRLHRLGGGRGSAGRAEAAALYRNAMTTVLQLNEDEITYDLHHLEQRLEKRQMREAFADLKKSMLTNAASTSVSTPLSVLLSRRDAVDGRLIRSTNDNLAAADEFNTTPLLVRHLMLDSHKTPVPIAKEVRSMLRQPKEVTARALLSEASPLLSELFLYNTRDTPPERAVDRLLILPYLVKQAKRFDAVDPLFPATLTGATHLMLSSMNSKHNHSRMLNNVKLHLNDTTSFLKNMERSERFLGSYGDSYDMTHRQNCNCPFTLHHDFRPSADEHLVCSFAYARPEVTVAEIRDTPYQANKILSDKHYVMALSKVDHRVTGSALLKKVSEMTEMRMNVSYNGTFQPSRLALSNSGMTTAGVNLDVIVRPNNARGVMGILECHRNHVCNVDAKSTICSAMPAVLQPTTTPSGNASELLQNALPHNRYIQKGAISAPTVIFANVLEQFLSDLGKVIIAELADTLATSVSADVLEDTKAMMENLGTSSLLSSAETSQVGGEPMDTSEERLTGAGPKLVSETMKQALYRNLMAGKLAGAENVPFTSSASGPLAYDFLLSTENSTAETIAEHSAATAVASTPGTTTTANLRNHLARVIAAVSRSVTDTDFSNILDDIEAKIIDETSDCKAPTPNYARAVHQEFSKMVAFLKVLKRNIAPALVTGKLGEKVAIYLWLLSAKSRMENLFQYGLSNSSSVDLSHLKPLNGCATKHIEDTFMYRNVNPVLIMALPTNFTALLQQEQSDGELAVENRRALTTFLNHPNTTSMAVGARAALGAGGGNPLGLYVSSHILQESTVTSALPVADASSNISYYSSVTQDPMLVVNPFKEESAGLLLNRQGPVLSDAPCTYLQTSMPTESSGLVTNTGVSCVIDEGDTFKFTRRDNSPVFLPRITPSVLCSDASSNLLDNFSRSDVVLKDVNLRFGFMPEIIGALALIKGVSQASIIKEMATRTNKGAGANTMVDPKNGDLLVRNGFFPDVRTLADAASAHTSVPAWGGPEGGKLHAKTMPYFIAANPAAAASVNGVPVSFEGFLLAEEKRKRVSGILSRPDSFGAGCLGSGALKAAANSRLTTDLEPLRKGWEKVLKLQHSFSMAVGKIKTMLEERGGVPNKATAIAVDKIHEKFEVLRECREILQGHTSMLVATSDLITGGYAGDPSVAMVDPVRRETLGIIGALSAPTRGIGHMINRRRVSSVDAALRESLTISSSGGRFIPEHGVVHKSSDELLTDADSIYKIYSLDREDEKRADGGRDLEKIISVLGISGGGGSSSGGPASAAKYMSHLLSPPSYGYQDDIKKQAIIQLLVANPKLMATVSNALFFTAGTSAVSPFTPSETTGASMGEARGLLLQQYVGQESNGVASLNRLFGSKLYK